MTTFAAIAASATLQAAMTRVSRGHRPSFLRALLAMVAARLIQTEGDEVAAEYLYRVADAVVARKARGGAL